MPRTRVGSKRTRHPAAISAFAVAMIVASDCHASVSPAPGSAARSPSSETSAFCSTGSSASKPRTAFASWPPSRRSASTPPAPSRSSLSNAMKKAPCAASGKPQWQATIVDPHREIGESQPRQRVGGGEDQLDLDERRGQAEHVDVALGELAEAALLRPLRAPHRPDLDGLQRIGQPRMVLGVVARERHREVEAQAEVGQILARASRRLQLLAALHDLEDELLVLAALAAGEQRQVLERGRLDAPEAVGAVDGDDLAYGGVAHAARRSAGKTAGLQRMSRVGTGTGWRAGYSPVVMMICVSPEPFKNVLKRTTAAMIDGGFSPGMAPSAVMIPSKPELTDWNR